VRISGDFPELRARLVNVGKRLGAPAVSPSAARAVFAARGEIVTVPAEKGDARVITNTPGVMERDPQWSPDGRTIAYFSDESGEYALHLKPQTGAGDVTKIALEGVAFPYAARWSPDSKRIGFLDNHLNIWLLDVESKKLTKVDKDTYYPGGTDQAPAWSPDSKWIAYAKRLKNHMRAIQLYSVAGAKSTQVTDGMSDARHPIFDKEGKYLYFSASTDVGASLQPDLHSFSRPNTRSIYLVVLDKSQPSPFAPESDDEKVAEEKKSADAAKPDAPKPDAAKPDAAKPKPEAAKAPEVKIDLDGIDQRILAVPMPARRYVGLQVAKPGVLLALEAPQPTPGAPPEALGMVVHRYDLKSRKSDVAIGGVRAFVMSFNGEKALYRQGDNWTIAALRPMATGSGPTPPPTPPSGGPGQNTLKVDGIDVRVDPREEWRQMYREAWRIERDFFYDPNMHGLDLKAAAKKYEPYLENIASRRDLTYLFQEMLGEMSVGHLGTGGGDMPEVKRVQTGLLGCDYEIADGRYKFARVYSGENWNPQARAPLTQPGVNVKAGDFLLAVNGRELRATENVYSFFEGLADKSTVIKVAADANGTNSREVTVVPTTNEAMLRNLAWVEENRRKVDKMTNGRVAYIYMPDTAFGGITNFNRYFYAQVGKDAAIVDERYNAGGALATDIIEILNRKLLSAVATRSGEDEMQPQGGIFGPKVMIINETAGSGGDAMPWYFRRAGAGKLIGTRTWGGLVGRAGSPELMDGGFVTAPGSGVFNPLSGEWEVENIGVGPDIEVEQDPELVRQGKDPQLERAVQTVLEELKKSPAPQLRRPKYPDYHKKEVRSESRAPRTSIATGSNQ
jgi:tricorn protease